MALWHELARIHTGEALIDAVATALFDQCNGNGIRPCPPLGDPHWRRRALAMLRQAGINPFRNAAVRQISMGHAQPTNQIKAQDHVA